MSNPKRQKKLKANKKNEDSPPAFNTSGRSIGLKQAEAFYRTLFDNAKDAIFLMDADVFIDCNKKTPEMFGCTKEQIIGQRPYEPFSPECQPDGRNSKEKAQEKIGLAIKGHSQFFEWTHKKPDGSLFEAAVSLNPVKLDGKTYLQAVVRDITQHKRLEKTLRVSEERFRSMVQNIPGVVYRCKNDQERTILFISDSAEDITGYPASDFLESRVRTIESIVYPEDHQSVWENIHLCVLKNEPFEVEYRIIDANGNIHWVYERGRGVTDKQGIVEHLDGVLLDITERKLIEEGLQESEERFRIVIENLPYAVFAHGMDGRFRLVNKTSCEYTGYTRDKLLGMTVADIDPNSLTRQDREKIWKNLELGGFERIESFHRRKDSSEYPAEITISAVTFKGEPLLLAVVQDITERKKAEQALQESESFLENIFNAIQDGISVLDADLTIRRVNKVMNQWYAANLPLEGKKCYQCYHNSDKPCEPCPTIRCMKTGQTERDVVPGLPGTKVKWIELFCYPIKEPTSGEITGIVEIVRDITEQKKAEDEIIRRQEQLKSLTSELAIAEEQERQRIAVGIHDDIGAKLTLAKLELQTLMQSVSDNTIHEPLKRHLDTIDQIINSVRSLTFELSDPLLYEIGLEAASQSWLKKNIDQGSGIDWELITDGPRLTLDNRAKATLFKGIKEAVTNAVKYAEASKILVRIESRKEQFRVTIEDNGIGFDPSGLATTTLDKGSFGLFYLKERLSYLGGELEIESEPNKGTCIIMTVPADTESDLKNNP